tara:strand:+ start:36343 stop:36975 length:633 start_codon:yes stop_codon:yes gene_type:complete
MNTKFICIEGNLGAGKTTLAKKLSSVLEVKLILETFKNNPFLQGLYENKEENKFPAEVFFLMERLEQLSPDLFEKNELIIADYLIDKTKLFAETNLNGSELLLFNRIFDTVKGQIPVPNAVIFIEQTPEEALFHVQSRGRKLETEVSLEYLTLIDKKYRTLIESEKFTIPIYKVNAIDLRTDFNDAVNKIIDFLVKERLLLAKSQVKLTL